jgi:general secretion pathway protein J
MKRLGHPAQNGFTLLELLIVLGILSFLGVASFNMAGSGIRLQKSIAAQSDALEDAVRVWQWLERDLEQMVNRPVRDHLGDVQAALVLGNKQLLFSKSGWQNPLMYLRSDVQRVEYQWQDEQLIRRFWPVMDRDQDTKAVEQVFENITRVQIALLGEQGWTSVWPKVESSLRQGNTNQDSEAVPLPHAVKVRLHLAGIGEVERLFIVPSTPVHDGERGTI